MKTQKLILISLFTSLLFTSCQSTSYYYSERNNGEVDTYVELQLTKRGAFSEYIFNNLNDSLDDVNEGRVIYGSYYQKKDTLFLVYDREGKIPSDNDTLGYHEAYLMTEDGLVLISPVTYTYHFLNQKMVIGKSENLRSLPHYSSIKWEEGWSD